MNLVQTLFSVYPPVHDLGLFLQKKKANQDNVTSFS